MHGVGFADEVCVIKARRVSEGKVPPKNNFPISLA